MQLPEGRTIDVRDLSSLAPAFKKGESKCGVYRLHFENGEAYPGQSRNVVTRFASHRRRWPDIVAVDFFPLPAEQLNEAEQFIITETEAKCSVRNIMRTNRPRGNDTAEIVTREGTTIALPWERERAKGATQSYIDEVDAKLPQLLRHPFFPEVRDLLGWYIAKTVQDPARAVQQLWTVSCMPSTNRTKHEQRLLTLSCGNLETLFIVSSMSHDFANDPDAFVFVNMNTALLDDESRFQDPAGRWSVHRLGYRGETVSSFQIDLGTFLAIIYGHIDFPHFDELLDAAFNLNTRLMRRGSTMYSRFHSAKLADLLLAEAVAWEQSVLR